jgi:TPR repeat protein
MRPNAASSTSDIMRQHPRKHRLPAIYANIFAIFWCASAIFAQADSIDSRAYVEKAVELIQAEQWSLARTYLAPALIDPRLGAEERSRAYYLQGYSYYAQGLPVSASKDYARALEFNPENGAALVSLGGLYHRGEGVSEDAELAFAFFDSAAEAGHPEGHLFVGYALLEGLGVEKNLTAARERLQAMADEGDATAMLYMGRSYRPEITDEADPEQAHHWYERAVAAGSIDARVALGYMHYKGELGEADLQAAVELFEAASEDGSPTADVALGHMYLTGEGVPMDPSLARELLERAAVAGNLAGSLSLGHMFEAGIGVDQDLAVAESWYLEGARAGFGHAQLRLFYLLLHRGEDAAAIDWIAKAAAQDLPQAQNDYAWLLSTSHSEAYRDGELALTYAERAVAQVKSAAYLDTLAAAYAELGLFAEAITTQEQALELVTEAGSEEALALAEHLAAYQEGQPWRE